MVICLDAHSEEARVEGRMEGESGWTIGPNLKCEEPGDREHLCPCPYAGTLEAI